MGVPATARPFLLLSYDLLRQPRCRPTPEHLDHLPMRNLFLRSILPLFALALTACSSTPPVAETTETMAFITHSSSMRTISFAFYSEHRPVAWPGSTASPG
jgi:hypothetical protein